MNIQRLLAVLTASLCLLTTSPAALSKPAGTLSVIPDEAKRPALRSMLRDVPAGTRLQTGRNQVLEVLFADGSSLTLAPNTELVVEAYDYDAAVGRGRLTIRIQRGRLRMAGGVLNNTTPIIVNTPAARLELDNGSAFVSVEQGGRTRTHLLLGRRLAMTSGDETKVLVRPGFELVATDPDTPPEGPKRMQDEQLLADTDALNPWLRGGPVAFEGEEVAEADGEGEEGEASQVPLLEEGQVRSDLVDQSQDFEAFSGITDGRPGALAGVLDPAAGFGGNPLGAPDISGDLPTQADGDLRSLAQNRTNAQVVNGVFEESPRDGGPTTNRLFNSTEPFTQVLGDEEPQAVADTADGISATPIPPDKNLQYVFSNNAGLSLVVDRVGALRDGDHVLSGGGTYDVTAPFLLTGIDLPTSGEIFKDDIETITSNEFVGQGSIFKPATHYEFLQAGFSFDSDQGVVEREADNFLLLKVRPGKVDRRFRDELKDRFSIGADGAVSDPIGLLSEIDNGVRTNNASFESTQQVNLFADIILSKVADLDLMASDVKGVNDFGYGNYLATIAPLLEGLEDLKGVSVITDQLVDDISQAFTGFDGTIVDFNPTVNINALRALGLTNGEVDDSIAFIKALGVSFDLDFTLSDVNELANTIVGIGAPAQAITDTDLSSFDFLNDKDTVREKVNQILKTNLDPTRTERFLFAAGDIDGAQVPLTGRELHRFFISPGLEGFDERSTGATVASGPRAFLRSETVQGLDLHDSGVLVVYPRSGASADAQNALLHADFGLEGTDRQQRSTISVTIGELVEDGSTGIRRASVTGRTLASSRDNRDRDPATGQAEASLLTTSGLFSTSSGGGNPALKRAGRAGYIVLENFDPDDPDTGGVERPLDLGGDEERYAILRLATATDAQRLPGASGGFFQGYAAGLAEFQGPGGIGLTQIDSGEIPGNVVIQTSPETNRLRATLNLTTDGIAFTPFTLGGLSNGASAFIDDDRFAALRVGANAELALVSGELVRDGLPEDMQQPIRDYQHVKWGFFFGDTDTTQGNREHVHLGTWVAGKLPADLPTIGTATYTGHAIGNVFNNGSLYTAVGSYRNSWDFAARRGAVSMGFDGAPYGSETRLIDNSVQFRGRLNPLDGSQRTGALHGSFVGPPIGGEPAGQVGRFSINETAGPAYRASGTFAAEQ